MTFREAEDRLDHAENVARSRRKNMLVVTRLAGQGVHIGDSRVIVLSAERGRVRLGIQADKSIPVWRDELVHKAPEPEPEPQPVPSGEPKEPWTPWEEIMRGAE